MLQIRSVLRIATITVLIGGISAAGQGQVSGERGASKPRSTMEMAQVDVFATRNWTSEDVKILGFHLGMSRVDAKENARQRGLSLNCLNYCDVCDPRNVLCNGIGLHFGSDDHIDSIYVARPLAEASKELRKFSVTQQFKGQTYLLFHEYSNALRLKLFGPESGHEGTDPSTRTIKYLYPRSGMEVYVSLSGNKRVPESKADLTVYFVHPKRSGAQASKASR